MEYRLAPLEEVVDTATLICKGATDEDRVIFRQWAWMGTLQIGPTKHWVKTCRADAKNLSIRKPKDYASTIAIALYDSSDQEVHYEFFGEGARVHTDRQTIHSTTSQDAVTGLVTLSEDSYYFHLGTFGDTVAYAQLRYLALPVDAQSQILVPEDNILAVTMFIRWHWAMRQRENQAEIELARDTWFREKDRIYGANKMPSYFDAKELGKKWLSLINGYKPNRF